MVDETRLGDESKLDFNFDDSSLDDYAGGEEVKPWIDSSQIIENEQNQYMSDDTESYAGDISDGSENGKDVVQAYLENNGIKTESIKFQDQNGLVSQKNWNDLTAEEQYNILQDAHKDPQTDLSQQEILLINNIREKGLSPAQYLDQYAQAVMNLQPKFAEKPIEGGLASLSDDDVYIADLITKVPDITDEEAEASLASAKLNPSVFERQVASLRQQFSDNEAAQQAQQYEAAHQAETQRLEVFQNSVLDSINNFNGIGNLDIALTQSDAENIAQFILGHNELGTSGLGQALQDPENLVKASWFLLNQDSIFEDIQNMVQRATLAAKQEGYNIGINEARQNQPSKIVRQRVPPKNASKPLGQPTNMTIDDLDYQF